MTTTTTTTSAKGWAPDIKQFPPAEILPESLLFQTSTVLGSVEGDAPVVRVPWVDLDSAQFTAEGDVIPEGTPDLNEVLVHTGKVTKLLRVSLEQWEQDGTAGALAEAVQVAIQEKANEAYLSQVAPVAPATTPPAGLFNVAGITEMVTPVSGNLDALTDLIALLETVKAHPSHIIMSPTAWAAIKKIKTQTGSAETLLGSGANAAARLLEGLPVITSPYMTGMTGLIIDKRAIASAAGPIRVAQSEHAYFTSDSLALRATFRFGQNLVHPARIGKFTVAAA
jgi:HK97 family phage major capsid protein